MSECYQLFAPRGVLIRAENLLKDSRPHLAQAARVVPLQIKPGGGKGIWSRETRCQVRMNPTGLIVTGHQNRSIS